MFLCEVKAVSIIESMRFYGVLRPNGIVFSERHCFFTSYSCVFFHILQDGFSEAVEHFYRPIIIERGVANYVFI